MFQNNRFRQFVPVTNYAFQSNGKDGYTYSYSTTGDAPIQNQGLGHVQFNSNLAEMKPGDSSSMRSDWSRTSSPPPEPELIQV